MRKILITNDDGIEAKGLLYLYNAVKKLSDTFVVAPAKEQSGVSHSLTLRKPLRMSKVKERWFKIEGTPADCVLLAHHVIIKEGIDIVLAGINHGPNMGEDVIYSGTVATAIEGRILGYPSIAISALNVEEIDPKFYKFLERLIEVICKERNKNKIPLLNINIPEGEFKSAKLTFLGKRVYQDVVEEIVDEKGEIKYIISGKCSFKAQRGSDFDAINKKYISVTPLLLDLTAKNEFKYWQKILNEII